MNEVRNYSVAQLAIALAALIGITILAALARVSADAVVAIYSGVIGAALASPLAARAGSAEGRANGLAEAANIAAGNGDGQAERAVPIVKDPSGLRYLIATPFGDFAVTSNVGDAINDLFRGYRALEKQANYVLPRRLNRATFYRARFDDAVRV